MLQIISEEELIRREQEDAIRNSEAMKVPGVRVDMAQNPALLGYAFTCPKCDEKMNLSCNLIDSLEEEFKCTKCNNKYRATKEKGYNECLEIYEEDEHVATLYLKRMLHFSDMRFFGMMTMQTMGMSNTSIKEEKKEVEIDEEPWKCPMCGYENKGIYKFCGECGAKK